MLKNAKKMLKNALKMLKMLKMSKRPGPIPILTEYDARLCLFLAWNSNLNWRGVLCWHS